LYDINYLSTLRYVIGPADLAEQNQKPDASRKSQIVH